MHFPYLRQACLQPTVDNRQMNMTIDSVFHTSEVSTGNTSWAAGDRSISSCILMKSLSSMIGRQKKRFLATSKRFALITSWQPGCLFKTRGFPSHSRLWFGFVKIYFTTNWLSFLSSNNERQTTAGNENRAFPIWEPRLFFGMESDMVHWRHDRITAKA